MKKLLSVLALCFAVYFAASAQASERAKDYIFSGMPEYKISEQKRNFEQLEIKSRTTDGKIEENTYEGNRVYTKYRYQGKEETLPSVLQIVRNYQGAVKKLGGEILWEDKEAFHASFKRDGKQYYVVVRMWAGAAVYEIIVIEPAEMQEEVEILGADTIIQKLENEGHIALYINFDTGKSTIKPESDTLIDEIVTALKSRSSMKVKLEGHTDNVGTPEDNKVLSNDRANAVMNAIIAKGVDKSRLSAEGFGLEKPIADNNTEEGRAKNRRVEMVRQMG